MSTVQDIYDDIRYRVITPPGRPFGMNNVVIPLINQMIRELDTMVYLEQSDLAKTALSESVSLGESEVELPDDFVGMVSEPWVDGNTYLLKYLPDRETALRYGTDEGTPVYYEVIGNTVYLYPATDAAITLKGFYFRYSDSVVDGTSTMPYRGIFDGTIREALVKCASMSNASPQPIMGFDDNQRITFRMQAKRVMSRRVGRTMDRVSIPSFI
jgi:hypothetical protein